MKNVNFPKRKNFKVFVFGLVYHVFIVIFDFVILCFVFLLHDFVLRDFVCFS